MFVQPNDINFARYDVIVAGSGPAGTVLAKRLAAAGRSVLIVETGDMEYETVVQDSYGYVHGEGHFGPGYWTGHWVRALGGTSAVWAGWVTTLSPRNLRSWPISYETLAPWYREAAVELGRDPVICDWQDAFLPGFAYRPFSLGDPVRYAEDFAEGYAQSPAIHVLLRSTLARLHPRPDRRGIAALTIFSEPDLSVDVTLQPHQSVVLAAGGMGNAQILLGSQDGDGAAVGNETDQVGRYLMEHPHAYDCARVVLRDRLGLPDLPEGFGEPDPAIVPDDALFERMGGLDASFALTPTRLVEDDQVERALIARLGGTVQAFDITARTEMRADPENRVLRAPGQDPAGLPRLRTICAIGADDLRSISGYLRHLGETIAGADLGRLRIANDPIYREIRGGGHTLGTTRMGRDPRTSVTDGDCRVHGYENLYIAGSSLFTTGGYANPTLTIVALAARLADHLVTRS